MTVDMQMLHSYIPDLYVYDEDGVLSCGLADIIPFMVYVLAISLCTAIVTAIVALSVKGPSSLFGTVKPPSGNKYGCILLCWYVHSQPLESAVRGYLVTVFHYFQHPSHALQSLLFPLFPQSKIPASSKRPKYSDNVFIEPVSVLNVAFPSPSVKCTPLDVALRKSLSLDSRCIVCGSARSRRCCSHCKGRYPKKYMEGQTTLSTSCRPYR